MTLRFFHNADEAQAHMGVCAVGAPNNPFNADARHEAGARGLTARWAAKKRAHRL